MILCDFHSIRPPHETDQAATLDWFVDAHVKAEKNPDPAYREAMREKFWRYGCKPDRIAKRGHIVPDYLHCDWEKMEIYRLNDSPSGADLSVRTSYYEKHVDAIFERYFPEQAIPPEDLIHVTCTGYVSPSGAQKIASKRKWGDRTTVTHAYHMGCYASIPAIRMGLGFLAAAPEKERVDIVHTEICSLHTNPANHNPDQIVSQSLFADGFIKYSVRKEETGPHLRDLSSEISSKSPAKSDELIVHKQSLRIASTLEEIIPDSIKAMTWNVSHWGFAMTLAKEVPVLIVRALSPFLNRLAQKAKMDGQVLLRNALFSVHPGGPKILTHIQELLSLSDAQMAHSFEILKNFGNMSSATLPHIWQKILLDSEVPAETPIVSLAFGPGLSITGAILVKSCGV